MFLYLPLDSGKSLQLDFQYMSEQEKTPHDPESIEHDTSSVLFVKIIVGTIPSDREWHRNQNEDVMKQACQKDDSSQRVTEADTMP